MFPRLNSLFVCMLLALTLFAAGCGGATPPKPTLPAATPTQGVSASIAAGSFRYELSGAFEAKVDGGNVSNNSNSIEHVIILLGKTADCDVTLYFPLDIQPGAHPLDRFEVQFKPGRISASSATRSAVYYAASGTLTLDTVSEGKITGKFEFTAVDSNDATRTITAKGTFNQLPLPTVTGAVTKPTSTSGVALGAEERNEEGGYTYRIIPGYTIERQGRDVFMNGPGDDPKTAPSIALSGSMVADAQTLEEAFARVKADFASGAQVSEARQITVSGAPGLAADITGLEGGKAIQGRLVVVKPSPTQSLAIFGGATAEAWQSQVQKQFEDVVASIQFFEPTTISAQTPLPTTVPQPASTRTPEARPTPGGAAIVTRQWASSATASTQFGSVGWSATQATGAPNTPNCGDTTTAWASASSSGADWLELTYALPVVPTQVNIVQSYNPSQVVKVELRDVGGTYHVIHTGQPQAVSPCPYTLAIPVNADYRAIAVRISVDQAVLGTGWNEIDAVELVGVSGESAVPVEQPQPTTTPKPTSAARGPAIFSVTSITVDPPAPKKGQTMSFRVTFNNATSQALQFVWYIKIWDTAIPNAKNSLGETPKFRTGFPAGTSKALVAQDAYKVTTKGGVALKLRAQVVTLQDNGDVIPVPGANGQPFWFEFTVTPQ